MYRSSDWSHLGWLILTSGLAILAIAMLVIDGSLFAGLPLWLVAVMTLMFMAPFAVAHLWCGERAEQIRKIEQRD